ncbi:hypothetical protein CH63R_14533 [Colletotrichum higginsianum IMI 349063]|uniref:Uncharacterized protein n=1 Tax=Colletotrichum higginsianum (strain IMI 349063) TaxID=759273 RepID=A0A1B7XQD6_COLHI|nr:hypothetical protein CH63R_14533 [Colletotrichum higginsianum IMI 349063]OBR01961.1 hypothetical protein CH63R_14533 [Colletotrichum higginsianum IMI 349063]
MKKEPASKSVESEETVLRGAVDCIRAIAPHLQHQADYRAEAEDQQEESEQNLAELEAQCWGVGMDEGGVGSSGRRRGHGYDRGQQGAVHQEKEVSRQRLGGARVKEGETEQGA